MKKGLKVTGVVVGLVGMFAVGSMANGSGTDWEANAINNSYSEFLDVASSKVDGLTSNMQNDVDNAVQNKLSGTVEEQKAELERLLEEYYQMKIDGLTDTEQFRNLESQIRQIQRNVLESYQKQIDQAFEGV